ncbi:MAG: DpnI domain-containing protein [Candidatus Zixiibacteriota bacterium]
MRTTFNLKLAKYYKSPSQQIRIMSEAWVASEVYCPGCGLNVEQYEPGRPVADFFCAGCREDYELKSKKSKIGRKIIDGAFDSMMQRVGSDTAPNFFMLTYEPAVFEVTNLMVIPRHFFSHQIIEKRKPLAGTARRAGWVGCNICINRIPDSGKLYYIKQNKIIPKELVIRRFNKTAFLRESRNTESRGWLIDIMSCLDSLGKQEFSLQDVYKFESVLAAGHPSNKHIKDKIRQQLQVLRDRGYLEFVSPGRYRLVQT